MSGMRTKVKRKVRAHNFSMKFSTEERLALEMLASEAGTSAGCVVRGLIRDAAKTLNRDAPVQ